MTKQTNEILVSVRFENPLAQACYTASKVAPLIRNLLENDGGDVIVGAWLDLDTDDATKALAVLRSTLNREAKKVFGHGLTVKDGKLVVAQARKRKVDPRAEAIAAIVEALKELPDADLPKVAATIDSLQAAPLKAVA